MKEFSFSGNRAVSTSQLRQIVSTQVSSKIPWGEKQYFTRAEFEADLKRIVAFYQDRGFPAAKVSSFDAQLSDDQKSVRLKVVIDEGEPIRVEQIVMNGLDALPPEHRGELDKRFPLKVGAPLDRALMQSSREAIVDELKDHGYPSPDVTYVESNGTTDLQKVITYTAKPGSVAYVGNIQIQGTSSVARRIVARQLTFRPGQLFQQSKLRESQRRLYSMELFNFVNIEAVESGHAPGRAGRECAGADRHTRHRDRGQASQGELRRRLRHRGEGARRGRLAARQLLRQRAHGGRVRALLVARSRGALEFQAAVLLPAEIFARHERAGVVQR